MINIKPGDRLSIWCARTPDGKALVKSVIPYTGAYKDMFDCVVGLECNTMDGQGTRVVEMSFNSKDFKED